MTETLPTRALHCRTTEDGDRGLEPRERLQQRLVLDRNHARCDPHLVNANSIRSRGWRKSSRMTLASPSRRTERRQFLSRQLAFSVGQINQSRLRPPSTPQQVFRHGNLRHTLGSSGQVPGQPAVSLSADGIWLPPTPDNNTGALWSASANVDTGPTSTWGSVVQVNGTTSPEATFSRLSLVSSLAGTTTAVAWCNVPDDSCQNEHVRAATVNAVSHAQSWGSD